MQLKTTEIDGKTYAEVQEGKPVYVGDDGGEIAFDAPGTASTIKRLNAEAKGHREAKEAAESAIKTFEGLDPAKARDAMDKLAKVDAKQLVAAGDMDAAIKAALGPVQANLEIATKARDELAGQLQSAVIGNAFKSSKFATEKLTPAGVDLVMERSRGRVKVEDGRPIGYDANGQKIYSKARPGELADFDEVVASLVEEYPHKEYLFKATGGAGMGATGGKAGGGGKSMSRAEFEATPEVSRGALIKSGVKITD